MLKYKLHNRGSYKLIEAHHIDVKEGFLIIYERFHGGHRPIKYLKPEEGSYLEVLYDE